MNKTERLLFSLANKNYSKENVANALKEFESGESLTTLCIKYEIPYNALRLAFMYELGQEKYAAIIKQYGGSNLRTREAKEAEEAKKKKYFTTRDI